MNSFTCCVKLCQQCPLLLVQCNQSRGKCTSWRELGGWFNGRVCFRYRSGSSSFRSFWQGDDYRTYVFKTITRMLIFWTEKVQWAHSCRDSQVSRGNFKHRRYPCFAISFIRTLLLPAQPYPPLPPQKLWTTFYPQGPGLDDEGRAVILTIVIDSDENFTLR